MSAPFTAARLALGLALLASSFNHFLGLVSLPELEAPLAAQMVHAFAHSGLLDVAMVLHLVAGAALVSNRMVPFALALAMPVTVCAAYIALVLEGNPLMAGSWLLLLAANGLLMLALLPAYRAMLAPGALAVGETAEANYGALFVNPLTAVTLANFLGALLAWAAAFAFYVWVVAFASGEQGRMVLLFPLAVLLVGGLRGVFTRRA